MDTNIEWQESASKTISGCDKDRIAPDDPFGELWTIEDRQFDLIYPLWIQKLSFRHWTPAEVARKAARMLVTEPGTRVLDVGCGPGKFCTLGAATTDGHFIGVEQRGRLAAVAMQVARRFAPSRVRIIHANITAIDFRDYDAFYLFNPFHENVCPSRSIDGNVELAPRLYEEYTGYVHQQLALAPLGTRVVTFHGTMGDVPASYDCEEVAIGGLLRLWIKYRKSSHFDSATGLGDLGASSTKPRPENQV